MHVHKKIHFGDFGNVALDVYGVLFRVESCCKIFGKDIFYVLM